MSVALTIAGKTVNLTDQEMRCLNALVALSMPCGERCMPFALIMHATNLPRDGREALIYCTDAPGDHPIHGRVHGFPYAHSWTAEGMCYSDFRFRDDLVPPVPAPPPRIREKRWCNVTR